MQILFKISTLKMDEFLDGGKMAENFTPFGGFFLHIYPIIQGFFQRKI